MSRECEEFRFPSIKAVKSNKGKDKIVQSRQSIAQYLSLRSNDSSYNTDTMRDDNSDIDDLVLSAILLT